MIEIGKILLTHQTVKLYVRHRGNLRLTAWKKLPFCYFTLFFLNTHHTSDFAHLPTFASRGSMLHMLDRETLVKLCLQVNRP